MHCRVLSRAGTLCMLLFQACAVQGAFEADPPAPRMMSLGGAAVCGEKDPWAVLVNPATLRLTATWSVAGGFSPGLFGMSELPQAGCTAVLPLAHLAAGAAVVTLGSDLYREYRLLVAAASGVSETCHIGVGLNLYGVSISGYGHATALALDAGFIIKLNDGILLGGSLVNFNAAALGEAHSPIPQLIAVGISYAPAPAFLIAADLVKDLELPGSFRLGAEYRPVGALALRAGVTQNPPLASAGAGVSTGGVRFDYAVTSHPVLGLTHRASLTYTGGE